MASCSLVHHSSGARCYKDRGGHTVHVGWTHYPGQTVTWNEQVRQDKRGRRIGRNWWREYNCEMLLDATLVWDRQCEDSTSMYATEVAEYKAEHPVPNLKNFLIWNKGIGTEPDPIV